MTLTCPICHSRNSVEAAILTEAGQAYTRLLLRQPDWLRYSLARYVLLFAPAGREMAYDRRLRLVEETLALDADPRRLAAALAETVEAIMAKRAAGDVRPLSGHNYLRKVLDGTPPSPPCVTGGVPEGRGGLSTESHESQPTPAPRGKRAQAISALEAWKHGQ